MDILYYRPMAELLCNIEENDQESGICWDGRWFPIGFMLGARGSSFFRDVHAIQMKIFKDRPRQKSYQGFGTGVYKSVLNSSEYQFFLIQRQEVYQHYWGAHARIFAGSINTGRGVGIHWYGGSRSAASHEPRLNHENWNDHPLNKVLRITL